MPKVSVRKSKKGWGVYVSNKLHDRYPTKKEAEEVANELKGKPKKDNVVSLFVKKPPTDEFKPLLSGKVIFVIDETKNRAQDKIKKLFKYADGLILNSARLQKLKKEVILWNTDRPTQIADILIDLINEAPDALTGFTFGPNPDDSAEFGWWPNDSRH